MTLKVRSGWMCVFNKCTKQAYETYLCFYTLLCSRYIYMYSYFANYITDKVVRSDAFNNSALLQKYLLEPPTSRSLRKCIGDGLLSPLMSLILVPPFSSVGSSFPCRFDWIIRKVQKIESSQNNIWRRSSLRLRLWWSRETTSHSSLQSPKTDKSQP